MFVCLCKGVTQSDLEAALDAADDSVEIGDIVWLTNATTECGSCVPYIEQMIKRYLREKKKKKRKKRKSP